MIKIKYPAAVLGVCLLLSAALPASASSLTSQQVSAIASLLQAFNVAENIVNQIEVALGSMDRTASTSTSDSPSPTIAKNAPDAAPNIVPLYSPSLVRMKVGDTLHSSNGEYALTLTSTSGSGIHFSAHVTLSVNGHATSTVASTLYSPTLNGMTVDAIGGDAATALLAVFGPSIPDPHAGHLPASGPVTLQLNEEMVGTYPLGNETIVAMAMQTDPANNRPFIEIFFAPSTFAATGSTFGTGAIPGTAGAGLFSFHTAVNADGSVTITPSETNS